MRLYDGYALCRVSTSLFLWQRYCAKICGKGGRTTHKKNEDRMKKVWEEQQEIVNSGKCHEPGVKDSGKHMKQARRDQVGEADDRYE